MYFKDRFDAGRKLASLLEKFKGKDVVVYALPRKDYGRIPFPAV